MSEAVMHLFRRCDWTKDETFTLFGAVNSLYVFTQKGKVKSFKANRLITNVPCQLAAKIVNIRFGNVAIIEGEPIDAFIFSPIATIIDLKAPRLALNQGVEIIVNWLGFGQMKGYDPTFRLTFDFIGEAETE